MNILFLHSGALGDAALAIHVAMRLAARGGGVTFASRSPLGPWAQRAGLVARAVHLDDIDAYLLHGDAPDSPRLRAALDGRDLVVSMLGGVQELSSRNLARLSATRVAALDPRPDATTLASGRHITQQWVGALRDAGVDVGAIGQPARVSAPTGPILIHPGSGGTAKCCPISALEEVVGALTTAGHAVSWLIGPAEVERCGAALRARLERTATVVFDENVGRAADVVAAARAYIGNDAGMTHVAALAGVPTVALFGPTDPRVWRPLGRVQVEPFPRDGEPAGAFGLRIASAVGRAYSADEPQAAS